MGLASYQINGLSSFGFPHGFALRGFLLRASCFFGICRFAFIRSLACRYPLCCGYFGSGFFCRATTLTRFFFRGRSLLLPPPKHEARQGRKGKVSRPGLTHPFRFLGDDGTLFHAATTQRPSFASLQIASSLLSRNNPTSVAWL